MFTDERRLDRMGHGLHVAYPQHFAWGRTRVPLTRYSNNKLENRNPRASESSPAEMDGVSFECMEMITGGTEAVAKPAFNWAR